ncbi:unnamed protein product [Amoebophrya sp. A25]|nr:unnamed protein product [Amoebophrya sp. A25]|eukprot:GSA25T00006231001.1
MFHHPVEIQDPLEGGKDNRTAGLEFLYKGEAFDLKEQLTARGVRELDENVKIERAPYLDPTLPPAVKVLPDAVTVSTLLQKLAACIRLSERFRITRFVAMNDMPASFNDTCGAQVPIWKHAIELFEKYSTGMRDMRTVLQVVRCFSALQWQELAAFAVTVPNADARVRGTVMDVLARACQFTRLRASLVASKGSDESETNAVSSSKGDDSVAASLASSPSSSFPEAGGKGVDSIGSSTPKKSAESSNAVASRSPAHLRLRSILYGKDTDNTPVPAEDATPLGAALRVFAQARADGMATTVLYNALLLALRNSQEWVASLDLLSYMLVEKEERQAEESGSTTASEEVPADKVLADKVSFGTVMAALPPTEWVLVMNLLKRMQELKYEINTQTAYAVLNCLTQEVNRERQRNEDVGDSWHNVWDATADSDTAESSTSRSSSVPSISGKAGWDGATFVIYEIAPTRTSTELSTTSKGVFWQSTSLEGPPPDARVLQLPRHLMPQAILTSKVRLSQLLSNSRSEDKKQNQVSEKIMAWKFAWVGPDEPDATTATPEVPADMAVLSASCLQLGRKLIEGPFHPQKTGVPWTEGLFRKGFALLLEDATDLTHPGWVSAVRLWQARDRGVFPQKTFLRDDEELTPEMLEGNSRNASQRFRLDFHPVKSCRDRSYDPSTVKVCLFCSLGKLKKKLDKLKNASKLQTKAGAGVVRGDVDPQSERKPLSVRIVTGAGESRLRKVTMEFLTSAGRALGIQNIRGGGDPGSILVDL